MGKVLEQISEKESAIIARSKVFFVGTAPLSADHHVSVSPKAPGNSCVVLSPHQVAYADLTGSGAETAAHVLQNGRMTLLFCNLERGPPQILRLHGKAELIVAADVSKSLKAKFPKHVTESCGFRAVYRLEVERVSTSCGYSIPQMDFVTYRQTLEELTVKQGKNGMYDYCTKHNSFSLDGLPSLGLLRPDGPKHVQPVAQDGWVRGQVMADSSSSSSSSSSNFKLKAYRYTLRKRRFFGSDRPLPLFVLVALCAFIAGIVVEKTLGLL